MSLDANGLSGRAGRMVEGCEGVINGSRIHMLNNFNTINDNSIEITDVISTNKESFRGLAFWPIEV